MSTDPSTAIADLIAKEAIRELALQYSRGVDRRDAALLRDLYTDDATDTHGDTFDGTATAYVDFLEQAFPHLKYSGHHICNHLISVDGDRGEGEVYALAYHVFPDGNGAWIKDFMCVRYLDRYRREQDGRWRFARRLVTYDYREQHPMPEWKAPPQHGDDPSFTLLESRLFARGPRA